MKTINDNRKKIVIATWKGSKNFGTSLQAFALNQRLRNMGYNAKLLSLLPRRYNFANYLKGILVFIGVKKMRNALWPLFLDRQGRKNIRFRRNHYVDVSVYTKKQENNLVNQTDCFVSGSDQIWNTHFDFNPMFFLAFAGNKKRIAYASSIGTNSVKEEYKDQVKEYLLKFSYIGVREKDAVRVLSELTGRSDIIQVLDPTFLLTPAEWMLLANEAVYEIPLPRNYIFCYLIGNNERYKEQLEDVRLSAGIDDIIIVPSLENPEFRCEGAIIYKHAGPSEFVDLIRRAQMVCTDSFHATAICINHSVNFVEFIRFNDNDKKSQNSRIYDLLDHYGLMHRIYNKDDEIWASPIDFQPAQAILAEDRRASIDYLVNAIEH